ncbi:MAG: serine/threonine-protein phosphatase [Hahellaceae bacterium]|nr:serine/threonine-protein phosphatase [Hahellaceae bacterium]MCP5211785.1 serine/threonine-protein phosphatase [Hahellaceae bacterium]
MIEFAATSDIGKVRKKNEDSFFVDPEHEIWIVADGVGGNRNGEIASQLTAQTIDRRVRQGASIQEAIMDAHKTILKAGEDNPDFQGMATTVVVCKIHQNAWEVSWVGDSRAYQWNGEYLQRLTRDHNYAQQLLDEDAISPEDANNHPMRHVLMHALGSGEIELLRIETVSGSLNDGDQLLLCTDGLCGLVPDSTLEDVLAQKLSLEKSLDDMIQLALDAGGTDNITAILMRYNKDE